MTQAVRQLIIEMSKFGIDIDPAQIRVLEGSPSKHETLDALIGAVSQNPCITDPEAFRKAVYDREAVMSTGIGGGLAIPHVRISEVSSPTIGVAVSETGVEFGTLDNLPVNIVVLFATPEGADKEYLGLLAQVMLTLKDPDLFEQLTHCKTPQEVHDTLHG